MRDFYLMHKDVPCGFLTIDETSGNIISYKDAGNGFSPFLGNSDLDKIKQWWRMRTVPATRMMIQEMIKNRECISPELYLAKNLALSMTDSYWVCPKESSLKFNDVKFSNFKIVNDGKIPYHNVTSYDPNASLGGQMEKYWDFTGKVPVLVKESSKYYGQQSVNEVFATLIHESQDTKIPYTKYSAIFSENNSIYAKCESFTNDDLEFIPAYEVIQSEKLSNSKSFYEQYIDLCVKHGMDYEKIQAYMDYQTLTDFVISNTDEHLLNFGILRDTNTMQLIAPAPIFDSGNSMFFSDNRVSRYSRVELLERKITSFYATEDKMLSKVRDKKIVRADLLPTRKEISDIYGSAGIPEEKIGFIISNYETKLQMLHELQQGKTISLYNEKKKEKENRNIKRTNIQHNSIHVIKEPIQKKATYGMLDTKDMYPIETILHACKFLINKKQVFNQIPENLKLNGKFGYIALDEIKKEIKNAGETPNEDLVITAVEARIKTVIKNGGNVVLDDPRGICHSAVSEVAESMNAQLLFHESVEEIPELAQKAINEMER